VNNLTQAVLFDLAITAAADEAGPFEPALEIGPHPAWKGPALETLKEAPHDRHILALSWPWFPSRSKRSTG